jgi:hypothetical protein
LIETGYGRERVAHLEGMLDPSQPKKCFAACKALRNCASSGGELHIEDKDKFINKLMLCINTLDDLSPEKLQALKAYGDLTGTTQKTNDWLFETYHRSKDKNFHLTMLGIIEQAMLEGSENELIKIIKSENDVEVIERVSDVLVFIFGQEQALESIIGELLKLDVPNENYIHALRQINYVRASILLTRNITSLDTKIGNRAYQILKSLGGEASILTYQKDRTDAFNAYEESIKSMDANVSEQYYKLLGSISHAFYNSNLIHIASIIFVFILISVGLFITFYFARDEFRRQVGLGLALFSGFLFLLLFYRNPVRAVRQTIVDIGKINVIYLGYIRQLKQIDLVFRHSFLNASDVDIKEAKDMVKQVQKSVQETMLDMSTLFEEMNNLLEK